MLNPVNDALIGTLRQQLPDEAFRPASPSYFEEPRGRYKGAAGVIVAPETVEGVASVVRAASAAQVGLVPYGGGTGLVAGQVMMDGPAPILLSLERMDRVRSVHGSENVLIAEAGTILATVQAAAEAEDRIFPLSYASEGSARIGGGLAVNSGGVNVVRYGNARDLCLGLEAVLPDGSIWHGLKRLRKDNTGYDLRNLLIGSEGTLGVITAAALRLYPRPTETGAAFMAVRDPSAALELFAMAGRHFGNTVSAFELLSGVGLRFFDEVGLDIRQPFETPPDWSVLIDVGLSDGEKASEKLETLFAQAFEAGLVSDGVIASSEGQRKQFWDVRETFPEANRRVGAVASHDISVPISAIPDFIPRGIEALATLGDFRINAFGHLGDGNLHYNVYPQPGIHRDTLIHLREDVSRVVHDLVAEFDGSFSAEHGVGRLKTADLERYGDPAKLAAMRAIKTALDPKGIMNPGVIFPI